MFASHHTDTPLELYHYGSPLYFYKLLTLFYLLLLMQLEVIAAFSDVDNVIISVVGLTLLTWNVSGL